MTKLIIIAAGTGSRLLPHTLSIPKPLVEIKKGKTILDLALEQIKKSKVIDEVILVVGYLAEQIEEKVKNIKNIKIKTIYNPYYDISGNLHSLWFAHNEMKDEDIMITNADNIIESSVFKALNKLDNITLAVCENHNLKQDDMKVLIEGDDVINVSKDIKLKEGIMESVSLLKIPKKQIDKFKNTLEMMVRDKTYLYDYWPVIFNRLFKARIPVKPFKIPKKYWVEVDYHGDLMDIISEKKGGREWV